MKVFVDQQIEKSGYSSSSEYMRDLIRQDQVKQAKQQLAELIQEGLESGPAVPADAGYWSGKRARLSTTRTKS